MLGTRSTCEQVERCTINKMASWVKEIKERVSANARELGQCVRKSRHRKDAVNKMARHKAVPN